MPSGRVVDGHVLGQDDDAALGRAVGAAAGGALDALDAGDGDHRAPLAFDPGLLHHAGDGVLGGQERAVEVHAHHAVPFLGVDHVHGPASGYPGRVDETVDASEGPGRLVHELGDGGLVGDVDRGEGPRCRTGGLTGGVAGGSEVRAHDAGALFEQAGRAGPADARGRPGDDHVLARQPADGTPSVSRPGPGGLSAGGLDDRTLLRAVRPVLRDPRPPALGARQRAPRVQERPRPGGGGRALRMGRVLDRGTPLPLGVLALLEPRGPLRGRGRAHRAHPHRLRGAAHAPALQPSRADGGVGGRARPALRRPGGPRHRALLDAGRARRVRGRPGRDPRHVAGGHRARGGVLDQRRVRARRQVLADAQAARAPQAPPGPASAHLGRDQQRGRAPPGGRARPGPVLLRRRGLSRRR